jgi:hypothetical protein
LKNLLKTVFERYNYEYDFKYDWSLLKKTEVDEKSDADKINQLSYNVINKADRY